MPFLVFLFLIFIAVAAYFSQLNPNTITFLIAPDQAYNVSLTALILLSVSLGGLLVMIASGVRQTNALYLNWTYRKRQKKETQVENSYKAGVNAFIAKRYTDSISFLKKGLAINANHLNTLLKLGEIYRIQKNFSEAIALHRRAILVDDQNIETLFQLADDLEATRQSDEAVSVLQEILHKDETNQTALVRLRDIYISLAQWEEAHSIAEKLLKLPLSDEMREKEQMIFLGIKFEKGIAFLKRDQTEAARRAFKSAVKINKLFLPAYIGLGEIYIKEDRLESSMTLFEKGYDITQNLILLHRLEEICLELGQPDRILQVYQKAVKKQPSGMALKFYLGKLYYRLEMIDEAFDLFSDIEGHDHFQDIQKIMGILYLRRGEPLRAAEAFQKALALTTSVIVPYRCTLCHSETILWSGRCTGCGAWNSYEPTPIRMDKEESKEMIPASVGLPASLSKNRSSKTEEFF